MEERNKLGKENTKMKEGKEYKESIGKLGFYKKDEKGRYGDK